MPDEPSRPADEPSRPADEPSRPADAPVPLVVLQSFPAPATVNNPYTILLRDHLAEQPGVEVHTFDWRYALTGRYDVLHVHWPEALIERRRRVSTAIRQLCYLLLLLRLRLRRTALVRTVHNLERPRGLPRQQLWLLALTERLTTLHIVINDSTAPPPGPVETIPHGHYRDWYARYERPRSVPGRLTFFGRIRRYKRADLLVHAFHELPAGEPFSLRIAGRASSAELADELRTLAGDDRRISLDFDYLADPQMVHDVGEAELVVLPYPEMHNSGSVLAALSLDRPVLVADNEVNRRLGEEVGPGWVLRYPGELTGARILAALRERRAAAGNPPPDLTARDWDTGAARHAAAYRRAVRLARPRR